MALDRNICKQIVEERIRQAIAWRYFARTIRDECQIYTQTEVELACRVPNGGVTEAGEL